MSVASKWSSIVAFVRLGMNLTKVKLSPGVISIVLKKKDYEQFYMQINININREITLPSVDTAPFEPANEASETSVWLKTDFCSLVKNRLGSVIIDADPAARCLSLERTPLGPLGCRCLHWLDPY
jgi:hypothetical protein